MKTVLELDVDGDSYRLQPRVMFGAVLRDLKSLIADFLSHAKCRWWHVPVIASSNATPMR
jgi:hypothetical protein